MPPFLRFIPDDAQREYREFWCLWREENFFAAHEILEDLWRRANDDKKQFFNGLIHAAVAIYQHRRGNSVGAARQTVRMQAKLARSAPEFYGVHVDEFLRHVEAEIAPSLARLNEKQRSQLQILRESLREM